VGERSGQKRIIKVGSSKLCIYSQKVDESMRERRTEKS
jgi:hypothetical protein